MTLPEIIRGLPATPGYYVYEFWDEAACIYVGRVGNNGPGTLKRRFAGHISTQPWWPEVAGVSVAVFTNHEEIVAEEARRIIALRPRHNRQFTTGTPWLPDVRERREGYQDAYRQRPERIAAERAREVGRARDGYYVEREGRPERQQYKRRWLQQSRRPGPGQAGLF